MMLVWALGGAITAIGLICVAYVGGIIGHYGLLPNGNPASDFGMSMIMLAPVLLGWRRANPILTEHRTTEAD